VVIRRLAALAAAIAISGCGSAAPATGSSSELSGSLTVFAASSLVTAFTAIGRDFEKANPATTVHLAFAGSSTLATQIQQGATGDVFASADVPNMQKLVDGGLIRGSPMVFARNRLQMVVAAGNPKHISGLHDLARPDLIVVLCAPVVPCGRYASQALRQAGVTVKAASQETDVKAVVTKISLGDADAGVVYVTDVKAAGPKLQGVDIPDNLNVIADYPIAILKDSQNLPLADAFVGYVLNGAPAANSSGQRTLRSYGFLGP
jgi:molybdate transport system substrate-binding protein